MSTPEDLSAAEAELLEKANAVVAAMVDEGETLADARVAFMAMAMDAVDDQVDKSARRSFALPQERDRVHSDLLKVLAKVWGDEE